MNCVWHGEEREIGGKALGGLLFVCTTTLSCYGVNLEDFAALEIDNTKTNDGLSRSNFEFVLTGQSCVGVLPERQHLFHDSAEFAY